METIEFQLKSNIRDDIRREVISRWMQELPGLPGQPVIYRYNVEKLSNGDKIYLVRPARLNKGCDFVIFCEKFLFFQNGNDKPPRHEDVTNGIRSVLQQYPNNHHLILNAICRIWNCEPPDIVLADLQINFPVSIELERVLKILRWMFIEQDVTYWTRSGRHMFRKWLEEEFGELGSGNK